MTFSATARMVSGKENSITLAQLTPNERKPFFNEIRKNCCSELKDDDVKKAFEKAFGAKDVTITQHGEGHVTFSVKLKLKRLDGPVLVTSRKFLNRLF